MGARLTLVANLNELETSFFLSSSLALFFFRSLNKYTTVFIGPRCRSKRSLYPEAV